MSKSIKVVCPCCNTLLTLDPATGAVLLEERRQRREHQSLDDANTALKLFHFSNTYLALLFVAIAVDVIVRAG